MAEPIKSNLEPIEESDLDLKGKLEHGGSVDFMHKGEQPVFSPERETPREVSAAEKDSVYGNILSKVQSQATDEIDHDEVARDAHTGAQQTDAETQIQHLIDIAGQKGVVHAVKVARHMEDNYILDTFHDRMLADELHDALIKKGMIEEI
ncbi:MAG TPA: hypothetical protein VF817_00330 [Patescibacteria group bacterium]